MSKNLMAHESAVASSKMFLQMLLIATVISFLLHSLLTFLDIYPEIKRMKEKLISPGVETISNKTIINYYMDFGFNLKKSVRIPEEFLKLFMSRKNLSKYIRRGNRISKTVLKKTLNQYYNNFFRSFPEKLKKAFIKYSFIYLFIFFYIGYFYIRSIGVKNDIFLRGTKIISEKNMIKMMKKECLKEKLVGCFRDNYKIRDIFLPREGEQKHILILGSTGTGKTVLANQIIAQAIERQSRISKPEKSILYDIKGEMLSKHFNPANDTLFYPFDKRCVGWNFMNEIRNYADFDVISTILFEPPKDSKDPYWYNAARDIFRTGLLCLYFISGKGKKGKIKNCDIWNFFSMPLEKIKSKFEKTLPKEETGALKHIESPQSPQAAGVLSVLQEKISFFKYLINMDGDFSFRNFISNDKNGNLFLLNIKQNDLIFRPLMTYIIDLMIRETVSMPDILTPDDRRINFFIDEFGSLSKLPSIFDFLTMARAKGGALCIINQDLGSVADIYGKDKKETFFNNFNTNFIFMLNDPTTAEFLSKAFGEQEIIQKSGDRQISPNSLGDTYTHREQFKINRVILPSELINLKPFNCFFKYSGVGFTKIDIEKLFYPTISIPFEEKHINMEEMRKKSCKENIPGSGSNISFYL